MAKNSTLGIRDKNKEKDFEDVAIASKTLLAHLRDDEKAIDLCDQLSYRADNTGAHRYYIEPYKSFFGPMLELENDRVIPFPPDILHHYSRVECASFMGILPEIHRVWVTVDNILYLWDYQSNQQYEVFDDLTEVIVSVGITTPKPGIFLDSVKYLLVLATPVDISVLAVCGDESLSVLRLSPTTYTLPSDNVTMLKIVGTQHGRIFMAGNDSNIYELEYSQTEDAWSGIFGGGPTRKCRKINHFAWNWRIQNILPPILQQFLVEEDTFADLIFDNTRNVLYSVSVKGYLNAFYIGSSGLEMKNIASRFDILAAAKSCVDRSLSYPEDNLRTSSNFKDAARGFKVIGLSPISLLESTSACAVVILANGIRVYLSTMGGAFAPYGVDVRSVRGPPSITTINNCQSRVSDDMRGDIERGTFPYFNPSHPLSVNNAYYSQGVFMMSLDKGQQPDELICIHEDLTLRFQDLTTAATQSNHAAALREGISIGLDSTNSGGKIYDIREIPFQVFDPTLSNLKLIYNHSRTPIVDDQIREQSEHPPYDTSVRKEFIPFANVNTIASASSMKEARGIDSSDFARLSILSEICQQHLPASSFSTQRRFLVLSHSGLHFFKKRRPSDILYRILTRISDGNNMQELVQSFFQSYGHVQSSAMCLGLAVGLPRDVGGAPFNDIYQDLAGRTSALDEIGIRAMLAIQYLTTGPHYRESVPSTDASQNTINNNAVVHGVFYKSVAHDALYTIVGRILRPIWLQSVVDGGRSKVSNLWSLDFISEIQRPLLQLKALLLNHFGVAIRGDSKSTRSQSNWLNESQDSFLSDVIKGRESANSASDKNLNQLKAKAAEDSSIRSLYMLTSRACHALSLISVLVTIEKEWKIPLDCSIINGLTFRSLVVFSKVHDSIKRLIHELVVTLTKCGKLDLADQAMDILVAQAYHYFSAGDRYSYEAAKEFDIIKKLKHASISELTSHYSQCSESYLRAASYWNSTEYIRGEDSELRNACSCLVGLGSIGRETVVEVCLKTAGNFLPDRNSRGESTGMQLSSSAWDSSVYHGGAVLTDQSRAENVDACYNCLIDNIINFGINQTHIGGGMLTESQTSRESIALTQQQFLLLAVKLVKDAHFHELLYTRLHEKNFPVLLLIVNSPFIEDFLHKHDIKLLYSYLFYGSEGRAPQFIKAAALMKEMAYKEEDVDISLRIEYFKKAIVAMEEAVKESSSEQIISTMSVGGTGELSEELTDLQDLVQILGCQKLVFDRLSGLFARYNSSFSQDLAVSAKLKRELDILAATTDRLKFKLLSLQDMYEGICKRYHLWDLCLLLLSVSETTEPNLIARFWRSYIYGLVPLGSTSESGKKFLGQKRNPALLDVDPKIEIDASFENDSLWLEEMKRSIIELAVKLNISKNSSHAYCPLDLLVEELEEIVYELRQAGAEEKPRNLVASCLQEMGVEHGRLVEAYLSVFDLWRSKKSAEAQIQLLSSITYLILEWIKSSSRMFMGEGNEDSWYCLQAIRSGQVGMWRDKILKHGMTLKASVTRQEWRRDIEIVLDETNEINNKVREFAFIRRDEMR